MYVVKQRGGEYIARSISMQLLFASFSSSETKILTTLTIVASVVESNCTRRL